MSGGTCAWCGALAVTSREIEPAKVKGDGTLVRRAIEVDCCGEHARMVDRNWMAADLRATIKRKRAQLPRFVLQEARDAAAAELAHLEGRLRDLESVHA
jgi:hypothetical protein